MANFGPTMGFGAPARADQPRTVTYGGDTVTQAQHASAKLGARVISATLGAAAVLLAGVAMLMSWAFVSALAVTWGEVLMLCAVATGLVGAMCGLPVAAALMERSYPREARRAVSFWLAAMFAMAVAAAWAAVRLEPPAVRDKTVKTHAAPLAPPAVRSRWMTTDIWRGTDGCKKMRTDYDGVICEEYAWKKGQAGVVEPPRGTVVEAAPSDWSPSATLGISGIGDGLLRRALVLFLNLAAVMGAGILGRWAVLATSESYRLGEGMASALPSMPQMPAAPASSAGPVVMQQDAFSMWASGRLQPDPVGEVAGDAAYRDYAETMRLNNLSAMSPNRFGSLLTRFAESSAGRVMKLKSNGVQVYRGVRLPDGAGGA